MKVLFVCMGNICRSPMAEAMLRNELNNLNLSDQVTVDSAGTSSSQEGNGAHEGTIAKLVEHNIPTDGLISRPVSYLDFINSDLIIAMDDINVERLEKAAPASKKKNIVNFLSIVPGKETESVPDPWITGDFDETYDLVNLGMPYWIEQIKTRI